MSNWEAYFAQREVCDEAQADLNCAARLWVLMPDHAPFIEDLRRATIAQDAAFAKLVGMPISEIAVPVLP